MLLRGRFVCGCLPVQSKVLGLCPRVNGWSSSRGDSNLWKASGEQRGAGGGYAGQIVLQVLLTYFMFLPQNPVYCDMEGRERPFAPTKRRGPPRPVLDALPSLRSRGSRPFLSFCLVPIYARLSFANHICLFLIDFAATELLKHGAPHYQ